MYDVLKKIRGEFSQRFFGMYRAMEPTTNFVGGMSTESSLDHKHPCHYCWKSCCFKGTEPEVKPDLDMKFTVSNAEYNTVPTSSDGTDLHHQSRSVGDDPSIQLSVDSSSGGNTSTLDAIDGRYGTSDSMAQRGLLYARRQKRRLILKDGECNISLSNVTRRKRRYLGDIFTTLLDMKWRYNLLMFAVTFVGSWFFFACIWLIIAMIHNDLDKENDPDWQPCMAGVYDFQTALLFSIETQHTIGYGTRSMESKCPPAVIVLMVQSCIGIFIQSLLTGIIFAKLSRPKGRSHTLTFSSKAVICLRDGCYCLLFRVADMRKSRIVAATVRAMMVKNRISKEGELLPLSQIPLEVNAESGDYNIFLVWPVTVVHKIDDKSPLWGVSADQLISEQFEIVAILEGTIESTGMTTQVRTSYLPSEVMWGHRQAPLVNYQKENGQYKVDYTLFHQTEPIAMPEFSAKEFATKHDGYSSSAVPSAASSSHRPYNVRTFNAPSHHHRAYSVTGIDANSISQLTSPGGRFHQSPRRFSMGGRRVLGKIKRRPSSLKNRSTGSTSILGKLVTKNVASAETIPSAIEEEKSKENGCVPVPV